MFTCFRNSHTPTANEIADNTLNQMYLVLACLNPGSTGYLSPYWDLYNVLGVRTPTRNFIKSLLAEQISTYLQKHEGKIGPTIYSKLSDNNKEYVGETLGHRLVRKIFNIPQDVELKQSDDKNNPTAFDKEVGRMRKEFFENIPPITQDSMKHHGLNEKLKTQLSSAITHATFVQEQLNNIGKQFEIYEKNMEETRKIIEQYRAMLGS